jgi:hypothetical protein
MNPTSYQIDNGNSDFGASEIRANLRRVGRRELWMWGNVVVVILGLSAAVVSLFRFSVIERYEKLSWALI